MDRDGKQGGEAASTAARLVRFPAYERAERRLLDAVFWARVKADPLLSQIEFTKSEHVGPIRAIAGDNPYDTQAERHSASLVVATETFVRMDFAAFVKTLAEGAEEAVAALKGMMYRHVGAISDQVGNTVDGTGKSTAEAFKEFFMRAEIDFDDDGTPRLPTLVGPPGHERMAREALAALDADPELAERMASLRADFLRTRPKRRLLSPC